MRDKGIISFSLRRYTATETTNLSFSGLIAGPLVQTERRVSGHDIKQHQVTIFIEQLRVTEWYHPLDFMVVFAMQGTCSFSPATTWSQSLPDRTTHSYGCHARRQSYARTSLTTNQNHRQDHQMVSPGCRIEQFSNQVQRLPAGYGIPRLSATAGSKVFDQIFVEHYR